MMHFYYVSRICVMTIPMLDTMSQANALACSMLLLLPPLCHSSWHSNIFSKGLMLCHIHFCRLPCYFHVIIMPFLHMLRCRMDQDIPCHLLCIRDYFTCNLLCSNMLSMLLKCFWWTSAMSFTLPYHYISITCFITDSSQCRLPRHLLCIMINSWHAIFSVSYPPCHLTCHLLCFMMDPCHICHVFHHVFYMPFVMLKCFCGPMLCHLCALKTVPCIPC